MSGSADPAVAGPCAALALAADHRYPAGIAKRHPPS